MADWEVIEAEYITTDTSYRKLADKYGIDQATISRKAKRENWVSKRQQHVSKTQANILTADTQQKVDRVTRLTAVADKLLIKVEQIVEQDAMLSAGAVKNLSDALKNIRDAQMIKSELDLQEQRARIEKLHREAAMKDGPGGIVITLEGSVSDYAQ